MIALPYKIPIGGSDGFAVVVLDPLEMTGREWACFRDNDSDQFCDGYAIL